VETKNKTEPEQLSVSSAPTLLDTTTESSIPTEPHLVVRTTRIGRFLLLQEIGAGGMGTVFSAYDEQLDRKVALKILRKPAVGNNLQQLHIMREARAIARISHPNVVAIYDVNESDGQIHIAMEYVEGQTLLEWQDQTKRNWKETLAMYLQVGAGLQSAHDADVVHRDFKPDNVSPVEKLLSKFQTLSECCREVLPGVSGAAVLPYSSGEPDDTPCKDSVSLHHRNASVALAVMNART